MAKLFRFRRNNGRPFSLFEAALVSEVVPLQQAYRLRPFADLGIGLAASVILAGLWYINPDPLTPLAATVFGVMAVLAVARPFLVCLAFIVFSFFRIHEAYPVLYSLHLPFLLGAVTIFSLAVHVFVVRSVDPVWPPELKWFSIFFLVATAGIAFAYNRQVAWAFWSDIYWKIGLMTLAVAWLPRSARDFQSAAVAFVVGGILVAAVTIYNRYQGIDLVELSRVTIGRKLNSLLADPNDLALVLLFPLSFSIALAFPGNRPLHRWLGATAIVTILPAVIFTQSRGGLLGLLAVIFAYALRRMRSKAVVVALTITIALLLYSAMGISSRIYGVVPQETFDQSADERLTAWGAAFNMAVTRPLTGVGVANFAPSFFYYVDAFPGRDMTSHSTWLGVLGETGWPGLTFFMLMVIAAFRSILATYKQLCATSAPPIVATFAFALLAGLCGFCVSGSFLTQGFTWPIYLFVGMIAAVWRYCLVSDIKRAP